METLLALVNSQQIQEYIPMPEEQPVEQDGGVPTVPDTTDDRSEFEKFHDSFRHRSYPFYNSSKNGQFLRERLPGEVRGKLARRIAKRAKVKLLKAKQTDN
jgi:hypothetical protein